MNHKTYRFREINEERFKSIYSLEDNAFQKGKKKMGENRITEKISNCYTSIENLLLEWDCKDRKTQLYNQFKQLDVLIKNFFTNLESFPEVKQRYKEILSKFLNFSKDFVNQKNSEKQEEKLKSYVSTLKELLWWFEMFHIKHSIKEKSPNQVDSDENTKFTNKSLFSKNEYLGTNYFFYFILIYFYFILIYFYLF